MNGGQGMLSRIGQRIPFQSIDITPENCGAGSCNLISRPGFMVQPEHFRDWKPPFRAPRSVLSERRKFLPGHAADGRKIQIWSTLK
jgi:hypothetical protein